MSGRCNQQIACPALAEAISRLHVRQLQMHEKTTRLTCCAQVYRVFGGLSPQPDDVPGLAVSVGAGDAVAVSVGAGDAVAVLEEDVLEEDDELLLLLLLVLLLLLLLDDDVDEAPLTLNWAFVVKVPVVAAVRTSDRRTCRCTMGQSQSSGQLQLDQP